VSPAEAWVRERLADAPPPLLEAMLAALPAEAALPVPEALAAGAVSLYAGLEGTHRAEALPLLAADALATHALQAQAERDPDGLAALAERMGAAGALGRLAG
jgi:hypothetical protein